jgi:hypothetical protein
MTCLGAFKRQCRFPLATTRRRGTRLERNVRRKLAGHKLQEVNLLCGERAGFGVHDPHGARWARRRPVQHVASVAADRDRAYETNFGMLECERIGRVLGCRLKVLDEQPPGRVDRVVRK